MTNPGVEVPPTSATYPMTIREFLVRCKASIIMKKKPMVPCERDAFTVDHVI